MDGSKNVSLRNTQFLGKYQGVSDFLAADQGLQGVRDLSHKLGASSVVQGRQGARDVPGAQGYQGDRGNEAGNEPGAGLGGQYDVPANQSNKGDRGKGAGNELGAGLGGQYEVPSAPAREAGQQGQCQKAQEGSSAQEQHWYPRRERRMPAKLKDFKVEISELARRHRKKCSVEMVNNG